MFDRLKEIIRLYLYKGKEPYCALYKVLGFMPVDIELYRQALSHSSVSIKENGRKINNERLEFLGDSVLSTVIADMLYKEFPDKREGFLTKVRSRVVKRETLDRVAVSIGLSQLVLRSDQNTSRNSHIFGNALEALIGAVFLDKGYLHCYDFVEQQIIGKHIDLRKVVIEDMNYKSRLLEWGHRHKIVIEFISQEMGADENNDILFQSEITAGGIVLTKGFGYTKKDSQQQAAEKSLRLIREESRLIYRIRKASEQPNDNQ